VGCGALNRCPKEGTLFARAAHLQEVDMRRSAAAMSDLDALGPILEEIVTKLDDPLPADALVLRRSPHLGGDGTVDRPSQ